MIYTGEALSVDMLPSGIAHLVFDLKGSPVNKFDQQTLRELREAVTVLQAAGSRGVIFSSAKPGFIVGADITEFTGMFRESEEQLRAWLVEGNRLFCDIEDLPAPTVTAINGMALGGGFEMAIATDYRVAGDKAVVGFPEVKLGILPGFGGTVRMPRLIGADNANQWISSGSHIRARQAFEEGALDAVVADDKLLEAAIKLIEQCNEGRLDYHKVRRQKSSPLALQAIELNVAFETARSMVAAEAGPHYPAPVTAVQVMQDAAGMGRAAALEVEHKGFIKLAKTDVAMNLIQMFLNNQFLDRQVRKHLANAREVKSAAVLGAGIMGGGIAYQSACKGTPIIMKDIAPEGIDLGMSEAKKLLDKQRIRGRLDTAEVIDILSGISPTLSYDGFDKPDLVVEAVIENADIKRKVLAELEGHVRSDAVIATNTSTISIDDLATAMERPENFCGMHFFNPVPVMPLVEVIKGKDSSDAAIATTVAYAKKLGKTPIVVNNCPGFLVNRILFPYFGAFARLLRDGADFRQIDKVMEGFGWPMGPAYLLDVVGIDTAVHAQQVMGAGFKRMSQDFDSAIEKLFENRNYGQKTGKGFYLYEPDKRGKPKKMQNPEVDKLIGSVQAGQREFSNQEIVGRMMAAMCLEAVRCLDDGIIGTAVEADMGLVLGLGCPAFRGGALRYIDSTGPGAFCDLADRYADLGALYEVPESLRAKGAAAETYYG